MTGTRILTLLAAGLLIGVAAFTPAQADWRTTLPAAGPAAFDDDTFHRLYTFPQQSASIDAQGFDLLGPRLLRYAHDGTPGAVGAQPLAGVGLDQYTRLTRMPDGNLLAWSQTQGVALLAPDGELRWSAPLLGLLASPPLVEPDGSVLWLEPGYEQPSGSTLHLRRLLPDGEPGFDRDLRLAEALQVPALSWVYDLQLRRLPGTADLLVAANENQDRGLVARISPQGDVRWARAIDGRLLRRGESGTLAVFAGGSVLVAEQADTAGWNVVQYGADGSVQGSGSFELPAGTSGSRVAVSTQGRIYQYNVAGDGTAVVIGRDAGGREAWRRERSDACRSQCAILATANGDLWVSGFGNTGFLFERHAPDGTLRFARHARDFAPALLIGTLLGERPDGSMLLALRRRSDDASQQPPARVWDEWVAYAPDGAVRASTTLPALAGTEGIAPSVARDASGRSYVVSTSDDGTSHRLDVVDAAGRIVGTTALEPRNDFGPVRRSAVCGTGLCVVHAYGVKAYREGGLGGVAWRTRTTEFIESAYVYRDGQILLQHYRADPRYADAYDPYLALLDAQGQPVTLSDPQRGVQAFDAETGALVGDATGGTARLRADGALEPAPALPRGDALRTPPPGHEAGSLRHFLLPGGDVAALVEFQRRPDLNGVRMTRTLRLARLSADGTTRWQRDLAEGGLTSELALHDVALSWSADGADLLLAGRRASSGAIHLIAIRGTDGEVLTQREVACPAAGCLAADFTLGPGRSVYGFGRAPRAEPRQHALVRLDGLFDAPRLPASAALAGLWYAPESTGQGLAVQVGADGTVGAAWFTHARSAALTPSTLRWYTLAGRAEPGATSVPLTLFAAPGGAFAAPPAVAAIAVGQARLWLGDCGRLEVRVRFEPGHVVGGDDARSGGEVALTLQRLLEPAAPCVPPGGGPAVAARVADAGVGGVWYAPATSGQGVFLYRLEATATQPAVLAGAWFTHDPAGSGSVAAESVHWFTLSAEGASSDGRHPLAVGQTIGGHLGAGSTRNASRIGSAEARVLDCQRLDFTYRFDDREVARAFRGRQGTLALQRLFGSCVP